MAVLTRPVVLPREILLHVWELEGLGETHPVLGARTKYVPMDLKGGTDRACFSALEQLGLAEGDTPTREFRVALRVLNSPVRDLYCYSETAHGKLQFAAASGGGVTVGVQVDGDLVTLATTGEDELIDGFLSELPEFPPASVPPLHTTKQNFAQRDENHDMFAAKQSPEKQLENVMKAPRLGVHQVYAGGRTSDGGYRNSKPFTVVDIRDRGRVVTFTDPDGGLHCLPGDHGTLTNTFLATWQSLP
ncbi:ESX secretion-associated protein EspG [Prauserella halophila]|uniref:ESX secretion-associated protein EspG n=1 Tax=Prauserella halophila TaxID=185641 RepID=A0ABN1WL42_9PSEU|nr:ESX secretion-associated protein EspG [Prauserella halophila]MCP2237893.1 EspG family protein [Prauserella halophila]